MPSGRPTMIDIPCLKIDRDGDGPDEPLLLEQECSGNIDRISLHPSQVRLLAERMGFLPEHSDDANRIIARLSRHLRILAERIDLLDDMMLNIGAKGRESVDEECAYSAASWQLANEFVNDLPVTRHVTMRDVTAPSLRSSSQTASTNRADRTNATRQQRYRQRKRNAASDVTHNASALRTPQLDLKESS
jgi:hypothetical protein